MFATPTYKTVNFTGNQATTNDIIKYIHKGIPDASRQTKFFSQTVKGSEIEKAKFLHDYIIHNVKYVMDDEKYQEIRFPSRLLKDGKGDCKSMALFIASVFENLKIPYRFVYASYPNDDNDPTPTHVYVETKSGIIVDPVWSVFGGKFNTEKPYLKKYRMQVRGLYGVSKNNKPVNGRLLDQLKNFGQNVKNVVTGKESLKEAVTRDSGVNTLARLNPAFVTARGAFLSLVLLNVRGLATALKKAHETGNMAIKDKWQGQFGGYYDQLTDAFTKGAGKKPLLGQAKFPGLGFTGIEIAGLVASAIPVLLVIVPMIKDALVKDGVPLPNDDGGGSSGGSNLLPKIGDEKNNYLVIGGVALLGLFLLNRKKK